MNDFFASSLLSNTVLQITAQAYGTGGYSSNNYNGSDATSTPTPSTASTTTTNGPAAPSTGYFAEPPIVTFPLLLVVAIVVGSLSFLISRHLRKQRRK